MRQNLVLADWGSLPLEWMERQCEEIFCDMLGVRIFGVGYLYAFEYQACPNIGPTDLDTYPAMDTRAGYLRDALDTLNAREVLPHPDSKNDTEQGDHWPGLKEYAGRFSERIDATDGEARAGLGKADLYLLEVAHKACRILIPDLMKQASEIADQRRLAVPTLEEARKARERFRSGIPTIAHMADIVNAGWLAYLDEGFWSDKAGWRKKRFEFINELVFKSLDVTEFAARTKNAPEIR